MIDFTYSPLPFGISPQYNTSRVLVFPSQLLALTPPTVHPHNHDHDRTNIMSVDVQTMPVSAAFGQPLGDYAPVEAATTVNDDTNTKSWYNTINDALADTLGESRLVPCPILPLTLPQPGSSGRRWSKPTTARPQSSSMRPTRRPLLETRLVLVYPQLAET